jgi:hypothetical protein
MNRKRKKGEMRHPRPSRYCFQTVFRDLPLQCILRDHDSFSWCLSFFHPAKHQMSGIIIGEDRVIKWLAAGQLCMIEEANEVEFAKFLLEV